MENQTMLDRYCVLVHALYAARANWRDGLSQDEEARRADELNDVWERMTEDERALAEKQVEVIKAIYRAPCASERDR